MDGMLSHLGELLEVKNIFVRNRKKRRTRALGILMYHYGLSLRKCTNQQKILVDAGPWYKPAFKRLNVKWEYVTFGLRNPIEQWFLLLKHRIKRFYRNWPYNTKLKTVQNWLNFFVSMYHFTRC